MRELHGDRLGQTGGRDRHLPVMHHTLRSSNPVHGAGLRSSAYPASRGGVCATAFGRVELVLLGRRAGAGRPPSPMRVSKLLRAAGVAHCHIEGQSSTPPTPSRPTTRAPQADRSEPGRSGQEQRRLGYTRFTFVNTVSVIEPDLACRAVGDVDRLVPVLPEADDTAVTERLASRERGTEFTRHLTPWRGPGETSGRGRALQRAPPRHPGRHRRGNRGACSTSTAGCSRLPPKPDGVPVGDLLPGTGTF